MTKTTKNNINLLIPFAAGSYAAYKWGFKEGKDNKFILGVFVVSFFIVWVFVASITKAIAKSNEVDSIGTGNVGGTSTMDTSAFIARLHDEIYCVFCWRTYGVFEELMSMKDIDIIKVAKDYFTKYGAYMGKDILDENFGIMHDPLKESLRARFKTLNIQ
jgi:hypothetical protein